MSIHHSGFFLNSAISVPSRFAGQTSGQFTVDGGKERVSIDDSEDTILDKMGDGNIAARLIAQQGWKSAGGLDSKELLALDALGIRGDDLVIAALGHLYKTYQRDRFRADLADTDPRARLRETYEQICKEVENPRNFRDTRGWKQDAFSDRSLAVGIGSLFANINGPFDRDKEIVALLNDKAFRSELYEILPELRDQSHFQGK